ncbi:MAG: AAA family ATPase [Leptolyngbya sp. SIOISBB]|nr:AAA family ATPase [Leptolyngbya sp. SIOISBB]
MTVAAESFARAAQDWHLKPLYHDLGIAKGSELTETEKKYLRGLLCGYSPSEIAQQCYVGADTVRQCLSKSVYRVIENLIANQLHEQASQAAQVKDWRWVPRLLEQAGYRVQELAQTGDAGQTLSRNSVASLPQGHESWDSQPDISVFYNRTSELALLKQWALTDSCRTIVLYGLGGVGKTALAAKLVYEIKEEFECLVWRSLRNQPDIQALLTNILEFLNCLPSNSSQLTSSGLVSHLIQYLQVHRCLLVFDDVQAILSGGELSGKYQEGFEGYGELLRRLEEEPHQSCIILTSWEKLREASRISGPDMPVRSYRVEGLGDESKSILTHEKLSDENCWDELISAYSGNPLALRIIAATIHELFDGSVAEFLSQNTLFLGDFKYLLHQQFKRLSPMEQEVIMVISQHNASITLSDIFESITTEIRKSELMAVVNSLSRRSLLEQAKRDNVTVYSLQPTVEKYVKYHSRQ